MSKKSPENNDWDHADWIRWRAGQDTDSKYIREGVDQIKKDNKEHAKATEGRLNGLEQNVGKHGTHLKIQWWFVAAISLLLLTLGAKALFGTERVFTRDSTGVTIRDRDSWEEHRFVTTLKGRDTITTYRINVENFLSYGFYIRANNINAANDSAIALSVVYMQSDTTEFFARVDGHSVIDTAITSTIDIEYRHWYPWYPAGLEYVKFRIYGNAGNDVTHGDSIDVRIYLNKMWKGTRRLIPGTGVHAHHHGELVGDVDIHGFVNFYADSIEQSRPALVYGYNSNYAYLYVDPQRDVFPAGHTTFNLGSASFAIDTAYFERVDVPLIYFSQSPLISLGGGTTLDLTGAIILQPFQTDVTSLGNLANRWKDIIVRKVWVDTLRSVASNISVFSSPNFLAKLLTSEDVDVGTAQAPFGTAYIARVVQASDPDALNTFTDPLRLNTGDSCAISAPGAYAVLKVATDQHAFVAAADTTAGVKFHVVGAKGYIEHTGAGDGDILWRTSVVGADKGDVEFYDNAANPAAHMWWDANNQKFFLTSNAGAHLDASVDAALTIYGTNTIRLWTDGGLVNVTSSVYPTTNKGFHLGSPDSAWDNMYADDFVNVASDVLFKGTGEEALVALNTLQETEGLPGHPNFAILDSFMREGDEGIRLNALVYVLVGAVQELEKKNQELKDQVWLLQGAMDLEELNR